MLGTRAFAWLRQGRRPAGEGWRKALRELVEIGYALEQRLDGFERQLVGRWTEQVGRRVFAEQQATHHLAAVSERLQVIAAFEGDDRAATRQRQRTAQQLLVATQR